MKILQINCVYGEGSTGKITRDIHRGLLAAGHESVVIYGRRKRTREPHVYKLCPEWYAKLNNLRSRLDGMMYTGSFFSTQLILARIRREKPDVVHLQCINGYFCNIFTLLTFLKKQDIPTVLTLHAEFMYTANCGYALDCERWKQGCGSCPRLRQETKSLLFDRTHASWAKMKKAFEGFRKLVVVSVSPWLGERAVQSPVMPDSRHCVIPNGLDEAVFHPSNEIQAVRRKLGLGDKTVVFHATAYFSDDPQHIKGGYYVLKLAQMLSDEKICFVVAGDHRANMTVPDNVILLGNVADQNELARLYSMADVTLLTSKKETFSMICAESLCCGTPVVGFCAGAPEQIALPEYSEFVPFADLEALKTAILDKHALKREMAGQIAEDAARAYSKKKMIDAYIALYESLV